MNTAFILFQRLHNMTQPRISRMWNNLMATPYANFFALIGTALCVLAAFIMIPADLAFFSLMASVFWKANPNELASQIETAKEQAHNLTGDSIGSILDAVFNWIIQQISISPSAHMISGNVLATCTMLFLVFIFLTDVIWNHDFLPLRTDTPFRRKFVISVCIIIIICGSFYYLFVLVNGEHQRHNAEISTPQLSQNLFDENNTQVETVNPYEIEDSDQTLRRVALVSYGVAMISSTGLAIWGTSMFVRVVLTLIFLILLFSSRVITFFLIEAPYTFLGNKLGFIQIRGQQPPDDRGTEQTVAQSNNHSEMNATQEINGIEPTAEGTENANQDDQSNLTQSETANEDNEIERRLLEEERQRLISKNPLGV